MQNKFNFKNCLVHPPLYFSKLDGARVLGQRQPVFGGKKFAFTLAEVLITLVIIGVIAALTIPNLMTKYQHHVLENQFKKSLYTISQIVARTRSDLGVSLLGQYCVEYDNNKGYYNADECGEAINENLINISSTKKQKGKWGVVYDTTRSVGTVKTYNNKNNFAYNGYNFFPIYYTNKLQDGSFLGYSIISGYIMFGVDLNGNKKPNRLGYDIFLFSIRRRQNDAITGFWDSQPTNISDEDAMNAASPLYVGTPCNLESTRESNGLGCAWFALRNKCPYDDTKTYWECLK